MLIDPNWWIGFLAQCEARSALPSVEEIGRVKALKAGSVILHSRGDDVVPFPDSEELIPNSGLPPAALLEVGSDHRLADFTPLKAMLEVCERLGPQQ